MTNRDKSDKTQASLHNKRASLSEVNRSITVTQSRSFWRNFFTFSGPGALVAVGYMDPGNWITSVVGGATYKCFAQRYFAVIFGCYAASAYVRETGISNPSGFSSASGCTFSKMAALDTFRCD